MPGSPPDFSFIVCSISEPKLRRFEESLADAMRPRSYETIAVRAPRSLCAGYNEGLRRATAPIVAFCHDDIEFLLAGLGEKILAHLRHVDILGIAGTSQVVDALWSRAGQAHVYGQLGHWQADADMPYFANMYDFGFQAARGKALTMGIQGLDGVFIAARRPIALEVGFDETTFDGFHGYDMDFSYRAFLSGKALGVASDIGILHYSTGSFGEKWMEYNARFLEKHRATLAPRTERWDTVGAKVLYPTRERLASSFSPQEQRRLAKRFAQQLGQEVPEGGAPP